MTNTAVLREDLPNMTFSSYVDYIRKIKLIKFSNIYIYFIYKKGDVLLYRRVVLNVGRQRTVLYPFSVKQMTFALN